MNSFRKDARLYARVHESTKQKLKESGYNTAEAVEWFVHEFFSSNPKRNAKMKHDLLSNRLDKLKKLECETQIEIEVTEKQLNELISDNPGLLDENLMDHIEEESSETNIVKVEEDHVLPDKHQEAINRIKPIFDDKKDDLWDDNLSDKENIDVFISLHQDMCRITFNECCKDLGWYGFKEFLVEVLL